MTDELRHNLILIPGLMCTADLFAAQGAGLKDVADIVVPRVTRHADLSAMAAEILAAAPERFALAGLSMGAYVAFEILRQAPGRVRALALLNSNARADRPEQIRMRRLGVGMARAMGARAAQSFLLPLLLHPERRRDRVLVDRVLAMADGVGTNAFERQQLAIIGRPDNRAFLGQINCPAVVIVGEQDALTPVKVAREMADGIKGSRLEIVPDCGHLSTMEQPDAVNDILRRWLLSI